MLTPNIAGSVTPNHAEIQAGTAISLRLVFPLLAKIVAATAVPWAIFDKAIIGHNNVVPAWVAVVDAFINSKSIAFVIWCNPVITKGEYKNPNTDANNQFNDDVKPANTTDEIADPIFQPIGPKIVWATIIVINSEKNGTNIICTTSGIIFLKNFSR